MRVKNEQLQWRRNKILELSSQGHSERDIAANMQIALGTVNKDIQYLKKLARTNISKYINETLPLEYQKCMIGLDAILLKTWAVVNNIDSMERDKLQAISIAMQAYNMKLDLLSSATVVERAVNFVNKHRGLIPQNKEVVVLDTAEPITNP